MVWSKKNKYPIANMILSNEYTPMEKLGKLKIPSPKIEFPKQNKTKASEINLIVFLLKI
ncbi:MAG: hypothetical protein ACJAZ9_000611 [Neolewinella sp.]|jgi:hypothetical protein